LSYFLIFPYFIFIQFPKFVFGQTSVLIIDPPNCSFFYTSVMYFNWHVLCGVLVRNSFFFIFLCVASIRILAVCWIGFRQKKLPRKDILKMQNFEYLDVYKGKNRVCPKPSREIVQPLKC
jgi:hypothetical protein